MDFKLVLKAYSTLRQLTDDESTLLTILRGMSDNERESLVLAMQPEKPSVKKRKPRTGDGKSQRASNMAATLGKNLAQQRQVAKCVHEIDDNGGLMPCHAPESDPIHDRSMGYAGYHEFVAPSAQTAGVGD